MTERLEREFQAKLIKRLKALFPGCLIVKNDTGYLQGIPDLTVFYKDRWVILEVKRSKNETPRPNQEYYIDRLNEMSYAAFVYPENLEEVLNEIQRSFSA